MAANDTSRLPRFDLTAVSRTLHQRGLNKPLQKAIKRLTEADSGRIDLEQARERLDHAHTMRWRRTSSNGDEHVKDAADIRVASSLLETAVLLYARVATDNDDRGSLPLMRGASEAVRESHKRILKLRNAGIGHFSYGSSEAHGEWSIDRIIVAMSETGVDHYLNPWRRANYKSVIFDDVDRALNHAIPTAHSITKERQEDLTRILQSLDRETWALISAHPVGITHPETIAEAFGKDLEPGKTIYFSRPAAALPSSS